MQNCHGLVHVSTVGSMECVRFDHSATVLSTRVSHVCNQEEYDANLRFDLTGWYHSLTFQTRLPSRSRRSAPTVDFACNHHINCKQKNLARKKRTNLKTSQAIWTWDKLLCVQSPLNLVMFNELQVIDGTVENHERPDDLDRSNNDTPWKYDREDGSRRSASKAWPRDGGSVHNRWARFVDKLSKQGCV